MIIAFPNPAPARGGWRAAEFDALTALAAPFVAAGAASGWAVGQTEAGDPQFFLLGPEPEQDCILAVSRLAGVYVLENGEGLVLCECRSLADLAEPARKALRTRKLSFMARIVVAWYVLREELDEKLDAVTGETADVIVHVFPQLATLV